MIRLRVKQFNIISMHFFLKSSLFLIVFALISSGISVWFDGNRREISSQLAQSRQQQEMFRDAYERLWDEFFSLQKSKSSLFQYADGIPTDGTINDPEMLICTYDHFKAAEGEATFIAVLQTGKRFLTPEQIQNFRLLEMETESKVLVDQIKLGFSDYCSKLDYQKFGQALENATEKVRALIILSRELKLILEKRISNESIALTKNYKTSNVAILIGFFLQLFVFIVLSVVDIKTSVLRRIEK